MGKDHKLDNALAALYRHRLLGEIMECRSVFVRISCVVLIKETYAIRKPKAALPERTACGHERKVAFRELESDVQVCHPNFSRSYRKFLASR